MRKRNARLRRAGQGSGHTGHNPPRDAGRFQRLQLLTPATEHKWVAALEPHNAAARKSQAHQKGVDFVLRQAVVRTGFTDVNAFGTIGNQV